MEDLMTAEELAEYLHLSPNYVRNMAKAGRIPAEAIIRPPGARKYLFKRDKIDKWAQFTPGQRRYANG